ncbi:MAG: class I SAM-dependent methyltransferase [Pseudomonadota bacterium]|nr:class I SAM-dependent methyltransferase [Pseudomonadota bacterium]
MILDKKDLKIITQQTLDFYSQHSNSFHEKTRTHDVSQNITCLLESLEGTPPFILLDFGCGPGRDLKTFKSLGHTAIGIDGCGEFVKMARAYSGCEVWQQDFLKLDLPLNYFNGVFANASLFHVPKQELSRILKELNATLKPQGVVFSSNPRGNNEEGWNQNRYGVYHDLETWGAYMKESGFIEISHYYRPSNLSRDQQPWLASLWRSTRQQ